MFSKFRLNTSKRATVSTLRSLVVFIVVTLLSPPLISSESNNNTEKEETISAGANIHIIIQTSEINDLNNQADHLCLHMQPTHILFENIRLCEPIKPWKDHLKSATLQIPKTLPTDIYDITKIVFIKDGVIKSIKNYALEELKKLKIVSFTSNEEFYKKNKMSAEDTLTFNNSATNRPSKIILPGEEDRTLDFTRTPTDNAPLTTRGNNSLDLSPVFCKKLAPSEPQDPGVLLLCGRKLQLSETSQPVEFGDSE